MVLANALRLCSRSLGTRWSGFGKVRFYSIELQGLDPKVASILNTRLGEPKIQHRSPVGSYVIESDPIQGICSEWPTPYGFKIVHQGEDKLHYELDDYLLRLDQEETNDYPIRMNPLPKTGIFLGCCDNEPSDKVLDRILTNFERDPYLLYRKPDIVTQAEKILKSKAHRHRSVIGFGVWRICNRYMSVLHNPAEVALIQSDKQTFEVSFSKGHSLPRCTLEHLAIFTQHFQMQATYPSSQDRPRCVRPLERLSPESFPVDTF